MLLSLYAVAALLVWIGSGEIGGIPASPFSVSYLVVVVSVLSFLAYQGLKLCRQDENRLFSRASMRAGAARG